MFKFRGLFLFRFMVFFILMNKEKKIVNFLEIWEFLGKGWSDGNNNWYNKREENVIKLNLLVGFVNYV